MTMITKQDILDYIYNNFQEALYNIHLFKIQITDELMDLFNEISDNSNDLQYNSQKYFIGSVVDEISEKYKVFYERKFKLENLLKLELPEQRSPEWYALRNNILTASSFAAALDKCHFTSRDELIYDKIVPKPYETNPITEWGVKYEEIATLFYQSITGTVVKEFGLIPHPTFPIFGASPDGICDDSGPMECCARMLEIKCPPKRKFSKSVPEHYWMQMQGQLEVCDLEECDFLQVKLEEYENYDDYKSDIHTDPSKFGFTSEDLPKGYTITYLKEPNSNKMHYLYCPLFSTNSQIEMWKEEQINLLETNKYIPKEEKYWKITRYECTLVKRDKEWWSNVVGDIYQFYNDLLYYKTDNNVEILKKRVAEKNSKKKVYHVAEVIDDFCLISDDEDNSDSSNSSS